MPYKTGNPVGSSDPRDLYDNAVNFDNLSTGPKESYPDRRGIQRTSLTGYDNMFDRAEADREDRLRKAIKDTGFQYIGDYAAGVTLSDYNQVIRYDGSLYSLSAVVDTPFTLSGTWADDSNSLVARGDAVLRQDLAETGGADLVGGLTDDSTALGDLTRLSLLNNNTMKGKNRKPIELIAHRGFQTQGPQNTVLNFTVALRSGADSIETDVAVSSDGVLYCFHDDTVDALTTGTGTFTELSSSYIDSLELEVGVGTWLSPIRIPRFSEFLEIARDAGVKAYPEIKNIRADSDINLIIQEVIDYDMEDNCCIQSFISERLEVVRQMSPRIELGALSSNDNPDILNNIIDLLETYGGKCVLLVERTATLDNPSVVQRAFSKNIDWGVWTVDQNRYVGGIMAMGINRIMSNVSLRVK